MTRSLTRSTTAIAVALGMLGFAAASHAGDSQLQQQTIDSASLAAFVPAVQVTGTAEEIPGAEDIEVDRGIVLPSQHPMNAGFSAGTLGAVVDSKTLRQEGTEGEFETGELH